VNPELTPLQRAALVIAGLREELDKERRAQSEPIAILGMACRFPGGATTPEKYWELLAGRRDAIQEVPPDRWNADDYYDPGLAPGTMNTRWGGFLQEVDQFDPAFFDLGQREASAMDPQHRLLLETAWEALEDAGIAADGTAGHSTGVFVGICNVDYASLHGIPPPRGNTGVSLSIAANRLSYWFDWTGPSLIVDTACSASLLSVHLAAASLRRGECSMALAGGVNLVLSPTTTVSFAQAGMMAPDGRCKTFDAAADGYVRGEGCGLVVLKRLSRAMQDGDRVLAVILGSATNQDGRTNGLTAPKGSAQVAVIADALRAANLSGSEISYVEAHGTGTSLGDAVEVAALAEALGGGRSRDRRCVLSAAKSNIGHLESAAGVAGLIKVVLALRHEAIPPVVHFRSRNPKISFDGVPFSIAEELAPWPAPRGSRYAGVSSFSFGGSNVHVVLGEAPAAPEAADTAGPPYVLPLAAKTEWSLRRLASSFAQHLARHPETRPADVCFTAACGRLHFTHRLAIVADSTAELSELLGRAADGPSPLMHWGMARTAPVKVGLFFEDPPDVTADWPRCFFETEPRLRKHLAQADEAVRKLAGRSLAELVAGAEEEEQSLSGFVLQYAQAQLLISLGLADYAAAGSGRGRWLAAALSGAMTFESAMRGVAGTRAAMAGVGAGWGDPSSQAEPLSEFEGTDVLRQRGCEEIIWFGAVPVLGARPPDHIPAEARVALPQTIANLYVRGHSIDWRLWHRPYQARKIGLPTYPFQRHRCWLEPEELRPPVGVPNP